MSGATAEELARLIAACARREESAFSELYQATSPKLFGVALRILKRGDWAEEIIQDCYVSIWTNAASYVPAVAAPMTWMSSIVRNRCLDWLRRPQLEVHVDSADIDDDFLDSVASPDRGPLELLLSAAESAAVARCLKQLETHQRQAVLLAFFDGLSHSELAAHLHEPLGTVKTWVRRGLMKLKDCLQR